MRTFSLVRDADVTGISGTGVVAEGVEFTDGTVVLRWLKAGTARPDVIKPTTVVHDDVDSVRNLHGHDGKTRVVYTDEPERPETVTEVAQRMIAELDKAVHGITFARDASPQEVWSTLLSAVRSANR